MLALSPGVVQGCIDLLGITSRQPLSFLEVVRSFRDIGNVDASIVVETCQALNWLNADEAGIAKLTDNGRRLMQQKAYELRLRQALLDFVEVVQPPWAQNATFGRARVVQFAGNAVGQILVEADLVASTADHVVSFWDELAARARGRRDTRLTDIGRRGERLTLEHEEKRTGRRPRWAAIESNADGYDVLSIVDQKDSRTLSIEVKASTMKGGPTFHLTRNEWETAQERDLHLFHLWHLPSNERTRFAVVLTEEIEKHVPKDTGDGEWLEVEIPFDSFDDLFSQLE